MGKFRSRSSRRLYGPRSDEDKAAVASLYEASEVSIPREHGKREKLDTDLSAELQEGAR